MARNKLADIAIENLTIALNSYRSIFAKDSENLMMKHRIANAQRFLGDAYVQKNDLARASENYEQAHAVFVEITNFDPLNLDWQQDLAMTYTRRGEITAAKKDTAAARSNFQNALPIFEKLASTVPDNAKRRSELDHIKRVLFELDT
ncbi:MAG: hypothetical protein IPG67_02590 [Acidobacteria bacterium]|nr:hypothetical protein [Acidobacteriota bacterium]